MKTASETASDKAKDRLEISRIDSPFTANWLVRERTIRPHVFRKKIHFKHLIEKANEDKALEPSAENSTRDNELLEGPLWKGAGTYYVSPADPSNLLGPIYSLQLNIHVDILWLSVEYENHTNRRRLPAHPDRLGNQHPSNSR